MATEPTSMVTDGIRVTVRTTYSVDESSPKHNYYVFAYQVEIVNESAYPVQLLSREWHITNGYGLQRVVTGEGVVGKKPVLAPGEKHVYVSGSHFPSPVGKMAGYYHMVRLIDGAEFRVTIPDFRLVVPYLNN